MNYAWYLVLFACFAIYRVTSSSNDSEVSPQDSLANQQVRTLTNTDKIPDRDWTTLPEELDIFNVRYLASNWTEGKFPIQEQCAKDITRYIEGLKRQEGWALKGT